MQRSSCQSFKLVKWVKNEGVLIGRKWGHVPQLFDIAIANAKRENGHTKIFQLQMKNPNVLDDILWAYFTWNVIQVALKGTN